MFGGDFNPLDVLAHAASLKFVGNSDVAASEGQTTATSQEVESGDNNVSDDVTDEDGAASDAKSVRDDDKSDDGSVKCDSGETTVLRVAKVNPDHSYASEKSHANSVTTSQPSICVVNVSAMPPDIQQGVKNSSVTEQKTPSAKHVPTLQAILGHQKTAPLNETVPYSGDDNGNLGVDNAESTPVELITIDSDKDREAECTSVEQIATTEADDAVQTLDSKEDVCKDEHGSSNKSAIDNTDTRDCEMSRAADSDELKVSDTNPDRCDNVVISDPILDSDGSKSHSVQTDGETVISDVGQQALKEADEPMQVALPRQSVSGPPEKEPSNMDITPMEDIACPPQSALPDHRQSSFQILESQNKQLKNETIVTPVLNSGSEIDIAEKPETVTVSPKAKEPLVTSNSNSKHKYIIEDDIPPTAKFNTKKANLHVSIGKNTNMSTNSSKMVKSNPNKLNCNYHVLSVAGIRGTGSSGGIKKLLVPTSSLTNLSSRNKNMKTLLLSSNQFKALNLSAAKMGPPLKLLPHKPQSSANGNLTVPVPALSVPITNSDHDNMDTLPCDIRSPGADSGVSTASPASVSDREDLIDDISVTPLEDERPAASLFDVRDDSMCSALAKSELSSTCVETSLLTGDCATVSLEAKDGNSIAGIKSTDTEVKLASTAEIKNSVILEEDVNTHNVKSGENENCEEPIEKLLTKVKSEAQSIQDSDDSSSLSVSSIMKMVAEEERRLSEEKQEDIDVCSIDQDDIEIPKPVIDLNGTRKCIIPTTEASLSNAIYVPSVVDEQQATLVKSLTNTHGFPDLEPSTLSSAATSSTSSASSSLSSSSSLLSSSVKLSNIPLFQPADLSSFVSSKVAESVDDASRDSVSSSISGRITPIPSDCLSASYELSSPGSKNLNIKLTEKVSPDSLANQSKSRATIGSFGSLTVANFKMNSDLPKEITSLADRQGVKMSTELYARLKSPGPVSALASKLSLTDSMPATKRLVKRSLLTNICQTVDGAGEKPAISEVLKTVGKQKGKKTDFLARSTAICSQDMRIKPKLGRPRTKKTATPKIKKEPVPTIDLSSIMDPQSEVHPLVDHDYCHFVSFCGTVQRSIIAKSESRTERKYTKKTKAARTKGSKSHPVTTNSKKQNSSAEDGLENGVDVEKFYAGKRSQTSSPSVSSNQGKAGKAGKKSIKEHFPTTKLSSETGRTKSESKRGRYERRSSADKKAKSAAAAAAASAAITQGKSSDKNYVKITGSYQNDFVYFATKRKSSSKRRQVKENPPAPLVPTQLPPVNVFDWYKEMSCADKSVRFGSEAHKSETPASVHHQPESAVVSQLATDFSNYIPTPVENMIADPVEKIDTASFSMSANNMDTQPDLEALGLTPEQVRTLLSAVDAAEMNTFKELGHGEGKTVDEPAAVNQSPLESSFDTENLQPSIDMSTYNDFMQARCGNTTPEQFLDIGVSSCNQGGASNKLFDLDDDFHDLLPNDMVNMNMLLGDLSPVKNHSGVNSKVGNPTLTVGGEFDHLAGAQQPNRPLTTPKCLNNMSAQAAAISLPDPNGNSVFAGYSSSSLPLENKNVGSGKPELFPNANVTSSIPVSEVTAPELTTVSMYWNDLPGLVIKNRQYVRLVDIHKQVLPAKDTGILKKRCQMLGLEIDTCTELQRDFLIRYANAAKSKSTVVVPKESAQNLIGFYVDPKPKVTKQVSAEVAEPSSVMEKKVEETNALDTSSSSAEDTSASIVTSSTRRDSSDSQTRRKQIQLKLKDQTVMRVVTEMEVSDDEEEEEEMEEGEDLTQIESADLSADIHTRHPHVRRMSKKPEDTHLSDDNEEAEPDKVKVDAVICLNDSADSECMLDTDSDYVPTPVKKRTVKLKQRLKDKNGDQNDTVADKSEELTSSDENSGVDYSELSVAESKENLEDKLRLNAQKKQELSHLSKIRSNNNKKQLTKEARQNLNKLKRLHRKELRLKDKLKKLKVKVNVPKKKNGLPNKPRQKKAKNNAACKSVDKKPNQDSATSASKDTEAKTPGAVKSVLSADTILVADTESNGRIKSDSVEKSTDVSGKSGQAIEAEAVDRVVQVLHRDSSHREGHRGRSQSGDFHLDMYQNKNSACVQCLTCRDYFSVNKFMKHLHRPNCPDEITEALLPQQLDLRSSASEKDEAVWQEIKRRRLSFEKDSSGSSAEKHKKEHAGVQALAAAENRLKPKQQSAATAVVTAAVKNESDDGKNRTHTHHDDHDAGVGDDKKERVVVVVDNEPVEPTQKAVENDTVETSALARSKIETTPVACAGTRHSSRVRKRKQLHPMESYVYSNVLPTREPTLKKQAETDSSTVSNCNSSSNNYTATTTPYATPSQPELEKTPVVKSKTNDGAIPNSSSRRRRRSSPDAKPVQPRKNAPKYDLRTVSSPEESPPSKRRRITTRRSLDT